MRRFLLLVTVVIIAVVAYILISSPPVDPLPYHPEAPLAMTGPLTPNERLLSADLLARGKVRGPEDTAIGPDGLVYTGLEDGRVVRISPDGTIQNFADTRGRPLGMEFSQAGPLNGRLIVADAVKGLLAISPKGEITVLATESGGLPFRFTDDLDIASDGTIFFTDASHRYGPDKYLYDLLEARPNGRFLKYDPYRRRTSILLDNLYFANGVALSEDESYVLVNETYRYRITRYWLEGPKAGTSDIFIDNLPGFPDNLSLGSDHFWVALFTVRNPVMDRMHPSPYLKGLVSKLPKRFWPKPEPYGLVIGVAENPLDREAPGIIVRSLHDPSGDHLREITSVKEVEGVLYMGTLHGDRIGMLEWEP